MPKKEKPTTRRTIGAVQPEKIKVADCQRLLSHSTPGGNRTPTSNGNWILNPARLPIPPPRQVKTENIQYDVLLISKAMQT